MRVVALSGGVGGAKLALGLSRVLPPGALTVVANVADDFEHLGLSISPDLDTLMYVLADLDDRERGWGRRGETWTFMAALAALGGETWFQLGDGDLATHVERTRRLRAGEPLSQVTAGLFGRLGIATAVLPATDDPVCTMVDTDEGTLAFQDYFVRRQCAPKVTAIHFDGAASARLHPTVRAALADPRLDAVIICPSNPFISIEPMLALGGFREALAACAAPVIAVSPLVGGKAVKGPTAKMMAELGLSVRASAVAQRYGSLLDGFVLDLQDAHDNDMPIPTKVTQTLMRSLADREALARDVLAFAAHLARTP